MSKQPSHRKRRAKFAVGNLNLERDLRNVALWPARHFSGDRLREARMLPALPDVAVGKKRRPTCAKCRNHGILAVFKGHKKDCPYQPCACQRCELTTRRRLVMRRQVSLRRSQSSEIERLARNMARLQEVSQSTPSDDPGKWPNRIRWLQVNCAYFDKNVKPS